jgi:2,3-bisphosphoglycerate-dependent phosphoglycerate mutase
VEVKSNVTILVDSSSPASSRPIQKKKYKNTKLEGPFVIFIRHGKTEYNKLGIFTGWDDAPLAAEGREQAVQAGKLLKKHGISFDIVYTSWLSRAIETAWAVVDELDLLWLPVVKSWRLNERMYVMVVCRPCLSAPPLSHSHLHSHSHARSHPPPPSPPPSRYGALTGMSKKGIAEKYGDSQLKAWRRGYAVQPPPVNSFSFNYPGNDDRYFKYVTDLRVSLSESIMRSIAKGRFELHRKFPKTESLRDCMSRTIPFYTDEIVPKSVNQGKKVLIASSENAIRGLLMHLCNIPRERIHEIDIPNGLPLVFNLEKKCIQLLDDGNETDEDFSNPLRRYNFGESPELLFKPCDYESSEATECFVGENGKSYAWDPIIRLKAKKKK